MSRVGKKPIPIPQGVQVKCEGRTVTVKGPKGTLTQELPPLVRVVIEDSVVRVERENESAQARSFHGLARQLIANMVEGVSKGFTVELEVVGGGYRVAVQGKEIVLHVGFSHPVRIVVPEGIQAEAKDNVLSLHSADKQKLGAFAARIRRIRPPNPYKGKGIRYKGETVRLKEVRAAQGG